jgi:DNA-binding IclR family transcriptional regulator
MALRTVNDALSVLDILAARGHTTVREVATELSRSRSGAYRVVRTLIDRGWVTDAGNGVYQLGPLALAIGAKALATLPLVQIAAPWLRRLVDETSETATLSVVVDDQRMCIEQVESPRQIRMSVPRGRLYPLYAGASGRSILSAFDTDRLDAYLSRVVMVPFTPSTVTDVDQLRATVAQDAKRGYAVARAERDGEAFSVASAIRGEFGVVGAIAICGPVSRFSAASAEPYGALTRLASADISRQIGGGT